MIYCLSAMTTNKRHCIRNNAKILFEGQGEAIEKSKDIMISSLLYPIHRPSPIN